MDQISFADAEHAGKRKNGLPVPANERVLGRIAQLADGGLEALAKIDVELDGSNSVFVGIHELPPGCPSF